MELTDEVKDRAAGVLLGQATGDALGVPYEFAAPIRPGEAEMIGGGLGPYEPGEWSDDTQMALCIARVAATGDLTGPAALDEVAAAFIDWRLHGASDIGNQTATVLGRARHDDGTRLWERMTAIATDLAGGGSAGNGGLMRTSVVGLVALGSADRTAEAARLVCSLTHAEQRCVESSVLWSLAVRHAVLTGEADVRCGLGHLSAERRDWWTARIEEAETRPPSDFTPNGYTVTAFQAAWASIHATRDADDRVMAALQLAISIGNDTDTVAAIAGGLLGAACGASRIPGGLAEQVHGWPGMDAKDLVGLGLAIAAGLGRESM